MSYVSFKNVGKKYENADTLSVEGFDLDVKKGEFIVFVGPSGCGKSTTLRMLAGLEDISEGTISIEDRVVNDVHPKDRDIAMVFQNYALYPHMTVYDNIAFGLKIAKMPKDEIKAKIDWAAEILGLTDYLTRKPKDLSGGQRQRVALGRAIVRNPKVFLIDEPLSNLDAKLRVSMRNEITKLHRELDATTVYVTHDQIEAMTMADRIVVLKDGIIQQVGTPMELYNNPVNTFVAGFIGTPNMNLLDVDVSGTKVTLPNGSTVEISEGLAKKLEGKTKVTLGLRPEDFSTQRILLETYPNAIVSENVVNLERMGNEDNIFVNIGDKQVVLKVSTKEDVNINDQIEFVLKMENGHYFDIENGSRLF